MARSGTGSPARLIAVSIVGAILAGAAPLALPFSHPRDAEVDLGRRGPDADDELADDGGHVDAGTIGDAAGYPDGQGERS